MKKCKIIHINDGNTVELANGDYFYAEEYEKAEAFLEPYLEEGYEVKHMIPEVMPAMQEEGGYAFYHSGFTVYLEKEE